MVRQLNKQPRKYHTRDGQILYELAPANIIPSLKERDLSVNNWSSVREIVLHRLDGPAIEYPSGYKAYYVHGIRHRLDGPTIEYSDGKKLYFLFGVNYSRIEFIKAVKKLNKSYLVNMLLDPNDNIRKLAEETYKILEEKSKEEDFQSIKTI